MLLDKQNRLSEAQGSQGVNRSSRSKGKLALLLILAIALLGGLSALILNFGPWKTSANKTGLSKPAPVNIAVAVCKTVPYDIQVIGTVQAYTTVSVKSQVPGQLVKVHFKQGDFVKTGDKLFSIDSRALEAMVSQQEAMLLKDKAQVAQARANVLKDRALVNQATAALNRDKANTELAVRQEGRYKVLAEEGAVSKEQYDQQNTNANASNATLESDQANLNSLKAVLEADTASEKGIEAQVKADEATLRNASVQLSYTDIRSPIDGRTGSFTINEGNMVKENDTTALITIDQIVPIYVQFAIPEQFLPDVRRFNGESPLIVRAQVEGEKSYQTGKVTFIDNAVDSTTGTIILKAAFENKNHKLWPGQFVNVTMVLRQEKGCVLVPSQTVQSGQDSQYVFVLKPDNTVEQRNVTVSRTTRGLSIITSGLKEGEEVVEDGQLQLTNGAKVEPLKKTVPELEP